MAEQRAGTLSDAADATVVGAGVAGLCAALHLARAGLRVTVLEASDEVGGRARFCQQAALVSEQDTALLQTVEAFSEVDVGALQPAPPLYLWKKRLRESEPVMGALPPGLGISRLRLSRLTRWLGRFGGSLDLAAPELAQRYDDRSAADFGALYFGRAVARRYVETWLSSHAPTRADDTSRIAWLLLAASRARVGSALLSVDAWSATPSTLFPIAIHCGAPVHELRSEGEAGSYALRTDTRLTRARAVVSTLAPPALLELAGAEFSSAERRILSDLGPHRPVKRLHASIRRMPGLPIAGRFVAVRIAMDESPDFSSLLLDRERRTLCATLREGRGGQASDLASALSGQLRGIALEDAHIEKVDAAVATFPVGRYRALGRLRDLDRRQRRERGRRLYFAGDWCCEASLEGAAQSGARAARDLLRDLELDRQAPPQPFLVEGL